MKEKRMRSGRFIGVMSGTSLDGIDVVLAAINENIVAQQASLTLACYRRGATVDPAHPSNYRSLALLYAISTEPVWTLVWGGCLPMPYWR